MWEKDNEPFRKKGTNESTADYATSLESDINGWKESGSGHYRMLLIIKFKF